MGYYALKPDVKVIAPWREWDLQSRTKLIAYAEEAGIPVPASKRGAHSCSAFLLERRTPRDADTLAHPLAVGVAMYMLVWLRLPHCLWTNHSRCHGRSLLDRCLCGLAWLRAHRIQSCLLPQHSA